MGESFKRRAYMTDMLHDLEIDWTPTSNAIARVLWSDVVDAHCEDQDYDIGRAIDILDQFISRSSSLRAHLCKSVWVEKPADFETLAKDVAAIHRHGLELIYLDAVKDMRNCAAILNGHKYTLEITPIWCVAERRRLKRLIEHWEVRRDTAIKRAFAARVALDKSRNAKGDRWKAVPKPLLGPIRVLDGCHNCRWRNDGSGAGFRECEPCCSAKGKRPSGWEAVK
jgi:hypothetical protein